LNILMSMIIQKTSDAMAPTPYRIPPMANIIVFFSVFLVISSFASSLIQ
jgi:hypothetical protein